MDFDWAHWLDSNLRRGKSAKPPLTSKGLAAALGVISSSVITEMRRGNRKIKAAEIPVIANFFGISVPPAPGFADHQPNASAAAPAPKPSRRMLPLLGQTEGGASGRFVFNGSILDYLPAPPALENVPDAYICMVYGDSMWPKYQSGQRIYANPHHPVRQGDFVVVQLADERNTEGFQFVKQFRSRNAKELVLEQFNPPDGEERIMRFAADRVRHVHKIAHADEL